MVINYGPAGSGNVLFSDVEQALQSGSVITKLAIGHGDVVDSIQATNGNTVMPKHGGNGGGIDVIDFSNDPIVGILGFTGQYFGAEHIVQMTLITKSGNTYGPYGTANYAKHPFQFKVQGNESVIAFYGSTYIHTDGTNFIGSLGLATKPV